MSAKTKIVVLHMKELIYTGIFAILGILLIVMLIVMFVPGDKEELSENSETPSQMDNPDSSAPSESSTYIPGIYTTELLLGGQTIDVEVIVNQEAISSIRLVNLSESIATMYPLLEPALESICNQVYETQSLDNITYSPDSKYTSLVLIEAIRNSLEKARPVSSGDGT